MPQGTSLEETSDILVSAEQQALKEFLPGELRASVSFAGQMFTETAPLFGDTVGQVMFSLNPQANGGRHVSEVADAVFRRVKDMPGPVEVSYLEITGGPPARKAVSAKVLGSDYPTMLRAANDLRAYLEEQQFYRNITP